MPRQGSLRQPGAIHCSPMAECPLTFADTVQAAWLFGTPIKPFFVVTHARIPAATSVTPTLAETLFTALKNAFSGAGAPGSFTNTTSFAAVHMRDLRAPNLAVVSSTGAVLAGTGTGDALPSQVAAVLTLRTTKAGKRFRGRMYLGGFAESASGPTGRMLAATKTALDSLAAALPAAYTSAGLNLAVFSRPIYDPDTCAVVRAGELTDVIQVVCRDDIFDTQRRRSL